MNRIFKKSNYSSKIIPSFFFGRLSLTNENLVLPFLGILLSVLLKANVKPKPDTEKNQNEKNNLYNDSAYKEDIKVLKTRL